MKKFLIVLLSAIFSAMLRAASPLIRQEIAEFLDRLEAKAEQTATPIDDAIVQFLKELLQVSE